jgi:hypothetical protein
VEKPVGTGHKRKHLLRLGIPASVIGRDKRPARVLWLDCIDEESQTSWLKHLSSSNMVRPPARRLFAYFEEGCVCVWWWWWVVVVFLLVFSLSGLFLLFSLFFFEL